MSGSRSSYGRRRSRSPNRDSRYRDQRHDNYANERYARKYEHHSDERKKEEALEPNINVVLRNLPDKAREIDIQNHLLNMGASIDEVSLIRDRETGESRKFAFVRFTSVGHAEQFVNKHRTFEMDSFFVRVDYSRKNQSSEDREEWRCKKCGNFNPITRRACPECRNSYISSAVETRSYEPEAIVINDGSKDVSEEPTNMMLIRQLDHLTTEESLYQAVKSLEGVRRSMLIRDKFTKMSCEFAFVEFINERTCSLSVEYARELLEVDGKRVLVSFASQESFIPVYGQSEYAISADTYEGLQCYWDKNLYATEYSTTIAEERKRKEEELKKAKEEELLKAKQVKESLENDLSAFYAEMDALDAPTESSEKSAIFAVPKGYK